MAEVKPAEVSVILKNQLSGYESTASLDEVGSVLTVGDGIARVYGLSNVQYGELVEFENGLEGIVLNLEEDNVGVVLLGHSKNIVEGSTVKRTQRIASINVGEGISGRVVNTLGEPIDGKGAIIGKTYEMPLERIAPGVIFREPVTEPLQTGIKAIDAMIPVGRGQRELVIGDRQTGKTTVCIDTILNQKEFYDAGEPVYCICSDWTKSINRCCARSRVGSKWCHGIHNRCGSKCIRSGTDTIHCSLFWCSDGRIFS